MSWFTTAGAFSIDHTGRSEEEAETKTSANDFYTPEAAGDATLFVVVRDDRGGVGWLTTALQVVAD